MVLRGPALSIASCSFDGWDRYITHEIYLFLSGTDKPVNSPVFHSRIMIELFILIACIAFLILIITVLKVHPIPALLIAGLILGLSTGASAPVVTDSLLNGFGNTLKWIGLVILFGTLLGEILAVSGGADAIADGIIKLFGMKRLPLSMAIIGFLVGIPVFADVAYLTLLPTIFVLSKRSGHSFMVLALSLSMALGAAHGLIPPTPGPLAVAAILELNIGSMIPINLLVAAAAVTGGLIWIKARTGRLKQQAIPEPETGNKTVTNLSPIKRLLAYSALLMPLILMSAGNFLPGENMFMDLIGNPVWALMIGCCLALPLLERKRFAGNLYEFIQKSATKSAIVILITGTGGAFGQVIKDSQIIESLFSGTGNLAIIGIALPFLLSFMFTTVSGSITVSLITTTSILAPLIANGTLQPEITAAAIGAGSLGIVHVNSSFFWLFKELHELPVGFLLRTFSALTGIVALSGGIMVTAVYLVLQYL